MKLDIRVFFENLSRKFKCDKFDKNLTRKTRTLVKTYVQLWQYLDGFFLEWGMYRTKVEDIKTHLLFNNSSPPPRNHAVYETVEKCGRAGQVTDDTLTPRMRSACWVLKATDTHWEYVILIAFPRQQSLLERTGVLHYPYIACVVGDLYEPRKYALWA